MWNVYSGAVVSIGADCRMVWAGGNERLCFGGVGRVRSVISSRGGGGYGGGRSVGMGWSWSSMTGGGGVDGTMRLVGGDVRGGDWGRRSGETGNIGCGGIDHSGGGGGRSS